MSGLTKRDRKSKNNELPALDAVRVGDARILAKELPSHSIDVTVTSPPYFDMKDYGRPNQIGFGQDYETYLTDLETVFREIHRATKVAGSLWIIVDTFRKGQEVYPLPFDLAAKIKTTGWVLRDIIIWKKDRTVPWRHPGGTRKIFEYILVFSKTPAHFRNDTDKYREINDLKHWWVRYPERYNPRGKAPEEIWAYDIPTQGSWGDHYVRHFCPLPTELVSRIIQQTTSAGDVVLDPFAGSGTVPTVANLLDRRYLGFELNKSYVDLFKDHLRKETAKGKQLALDLDDMRPQQDFEAQIVDLRILKFGRLLLRALSEKFPSARPAVFVYRQKKRPTERFKHYTAEYVIALQRKKDASEALLLVEAMIAKPPLSKFGIQPTISVAFKPVEIALGKRRADHFRYTSTNSHFHIGQVAFEDAWKFEGGLFSPIEMQVEETNG